MAEFHFPTESILKPALLKWEGVYFKLTQYIFIYFIKMLLLNEAKIYLIVFKINAYLQNSLHTQMQKNLM